MARKYNPQEIEPKWQKYWEEKKMHQANDDDPRPKYYCLDMFPYPSGSGLHVGHWRGYVLSDVWSRYKTLQGYNVLHPMGWDAFGLPAENYAIQNKIHPAKAVKTNIENFKRQLKDIGAMYDWSREINTTDPEYYKWTQWIFVQMFKKGLAYRKEMPINWCPECKTGLANEEVVNGCCERCGAEITKKNLKQWMLKITAYAQRLLDDLKDLDWPEKVKKMQTNWIGRSEGAEITFKVDGHDETITVFTTRPDTLFGATYMVLAPEHPVVEKITTPEQKTSVEKYVDETLKKSNVERMIEDKKKTGVFTGAYAINPINGEKLPIWISDYVLMDYGTGAIMAVPAHDQRDFEFAKEFGLPIKVVIRPDGETFEAEDLKEAYTGPGKMVNSGEFTGLDWEEGKKKVTQYLADRGIGKATVNYKLRDWVFSRQRYWGEPIPIIHCEKCGMVAVPEEELPVRLPDVESYEPTGTGESPLAAIEEWVNTTCPECGGPAKRETDTMPQWAGSSWYFLRYPDPHNTEEPFSKKAMKKWMPVDLYVGGVEHAILHLLYARFFTKFLYDIGVVDFKEPFKRLFNQGMIYKDGAKMSKSKGNVVSPDELIEKYGRDAIRLYELFIGPPEVDVEWSDQGFEGVARFLNRTWNLITEIVEEGKFIEPTKELERARHGLIKDVTERIEEMKLNTAVSAFMSYVNFLSKQRETGVDRASIETLVLLLAPFTPHLSEELWEILGHNESIFTEKWPEYDPEMLVTQEMELPIQVNGKVRDTLVIDVNASKEEILTKAKELSNVQKHIEGKTIVKEIYVPKKIVNIVVKG
ncbi:leucine--tRNA ligase [Anoxybacter fermentans]|uniref:Leucine--tRNA ligase n=1 Tax=Anoxybacter fermentans TaxID=1323375 RepID=A0A3Q9HRB6_9FIRM|nr:leucine--tRNA ligase [Anoxybacter fermentans]AZR73636.1 leucine--tRNA ligase [Anoxybacter fermentans]